MKDTKRTYNFYSAWNWQQEIDDLNAQSDAGWQLMHGGLVSSRFKYQPGVRYRYQLDYPGKIDEMPRYLELFREQGWEFVNKTCNGWYYFRKPYDPDVDPAEYEINTDRASLKEMTGRWVKLGSVLAVLLALLLIVLLVLFILRPMWQELCLILALLPMFIMLLRGMVLIKREDVKRTIHNDGKWVGACLLAFVVFYAGFVLLAANRPSVQWNRMSDDTEAISAEAENTVVWGQFEIRYPDNYYLSLDVKADAPMTILLVNENGDALHTFSGEAKKEEDVRLWLQRGEYYLQLTEFAGGCEEVTFKLN